MLKRTCIPFYSQRASELERLSAEVARRPLAYGETHQQRQEAADGLLHEAEEVTAARRDAHDERFMRVVGQDYATGWHPHNAILVTYPPVGDEARIIQAGRSGSQFQRQNPPKGARSRAKREKARQQAITAKAIRWAHTPPAKRAADTLVGGEQYLTGKQRRRQRLTLRRAEAETESLRRLAREQRQACG